MTTIPKNSPKKEAFKLTKLWQEHGPNYYPLDINQLIDGALNKSSFESKLIVREGKFDSFEGSLVRTKNTETWTILLNKNTGSSRRRRFTFAHELGHFMCHRYIQEKFEDSEDSLNNFRIEIEQEANLFAAWLLMPANLVRNEFRQSTWSTDTLMEIANRFECSLQASAMRYVMLSDRPIAFVVSRDGMIVWACKSDIAPFMSAYKFGDELPTGSHARLCFETGVDIQNPESIEAVWNHYSRTRESQYFDRSGNGYQYTCLEFG